MKGRSLTARLVVEGFSFSLKESEKLFSLWRRKEEQFHTMCRRESHLPYGITASGYYVSARTRGLDRQLEGSPMITALRWSVAVAEPLDSC